VKIWSKKKKKETNKKTGCNDLKRNMQFGLKRNSFTTVDKEGVVVEQIWDIKKKPRILYWDNRKNAS
jgi:hypothetical protein